MKPAVLLLVCLGQFSSYGQTAKEIVQSADAKMRGTTSQAQITIQTIRPSWSREMTVTTWVKGRDLAMIQVLYLLRTKALFI